MEFIISVADITISFLFCTKINYLENKPEGAGQPGDNNRASCSRAPPQAQTRAYSSSQLVYSINKIHTSNFVAPLMNLMFIFLDQIFDADRQILQDHAIGPVQGRSTGRNWWPAVSGNLRRYLQI